MPLCSSRPLAATRWFPHNLIFAGMHTEHLGGHVPAHKFEFASDTLALRRARTPTSPESNSLQEFLFLKRHSPHFKESGEDCLQSWSNIPVSPQTKMRRYL